MSSRPIDDRLARKAPWLLALMGVGVAAPSVAGGVAGVEARGPALFAASIAIVGATVVAGALWWRAPVRRPLRMPRVLFVLVPFATAAIAVVALATALGADAGSFVCCALCLAVVAFLPAAALASTWGRGAIPGGPGTTRIVVATATLWFLGVWLGTFMSGVAFEPVDCDAPNVVVRGASEPACAVQAARLFRFGAAVLATFAIGISILLRGRRGWRVSLLPLAGLAIWFATQAITAAFDVELAAAMCAAEGDDRAADTAALPGAARVFETTGLGLALVAWLVGGALAAASARRDGALRNEWRATWPLVPTLLFASGPWSVLRSGEWVALEVPPLPIAPFVFAAMATPIVLGLVFAHELRRASRRCAGAVGAAPSADARVLPGWVHWRLATMRQPRELNPYRASPDPRAIALAHRAALWTMLGSIVRSGAWRAARAASIWAGLAFGLCSLWWLLFIATR